MTSIMRASIPDVPVRRSAQISACGAYRYSLEREWGDAPPLLFVMLNPSTADARLDDPTIRRCMGFARREGAGGLWVCNLFALRATDPAALRGHGDPVGPGNVEALGLLLLQAAVSNVPVVAAWGACPDLDEQDGRFIARAHDCDADLRCLGVTKDGHPRHPLYVRGDQPLQPFGYAREAAHG